MENELGWIIITTFFALRSKTYSYWTDDDKNSKKVKVTKNCVIKRILKFIDYKNCLFKHDIVLKSQQR